MSLQRRRTIAVWMTRFGLLCLLVFFVAARDVLKEPDSHWSRKLLMVLVVVGAIATVGGRFAIFDIDRELRKRSRDSSL